MLLNAGLLTRQVGTQEGYLFAVAGSGRVVSSIMKGRKVSTCLYPMPASVWDGSMKSQGMQDLLEGPSKGKKWTSRAAFAEY